MPDQNETYTLHLTPLQVEHLRSALGVYANYLLERWNFDDVTDQLTIETDIGEVPVGLLQEMGRQTIKNVLELRDMLPRS